MNTNEFIRIGFEESTASEYIDNDVIICESCKDACATNWSRNMEVCTDCYTEMGV